MLAHDENGLPPLQIWEMAKNIDEDFQEAISVDFPPKHPTQRGWVTPPMGYYKVNVDGTTYIDGLGTSRVGVIIRDEEGRVVAALRKALPLHYLVDWTELFAMEQGVLLALEMTLPNVIFETDAISVSQAVSQDLSGGAMGHLIQGIQLAKSSFSCYSFHHVKRDYNSV